MFRSWGAIGSPIFAEIEGGRGPNGTFLGDFTWNDPYINQVVGFKLHVGNVSLYPDSSGGHILFHTTYKEKCHVVKVLLGILCFLIKSDG